MINLIVLIIFLLSCLHASLLTGLDVIQEEDFKLIHNKNIGLVINHTSLNREGIHILDLLLSNEKVKVVSIFTPEHGLKGTFSAGEKVTYDYDQDLGIDIISLYGNKRQPDLADLENIDCLIFDIQDIGSRYYTYVSTLTYMLNASALYDIPIIVLDRPNPLGRHVYGPSISSKFHSFVGMHSIPIRHGMTIGELALMINDLGWLPSLKKANLKVIKLKSWDTLSGYFKVSPSPNIANFETALMYNGMCLLEGTNISEGRGTETPFLLFGAPWMNSSLILKDLIELDYPGISFYQKTFKPYSRQGAKYPKYKNQLCYGIRIDVLDQSKINPLKVSVSILKTIYKYHYEQFSFNNNNFIEKLYGSDILEKNIKDKASIQNLINIWDQDSKAFISQREPYLLY